MNTIRISTGLIILALLNFVVVDAEATPPAEGQISSNVENGVIGVCIAPSSPWCRICKIAKGFPAETQGISYADTILEIDGKEIWGMNITNVCEMLRGVVGTRVKVTIKKAGTEECKTLSIIRVANKSPDQIEWIPTNEVSSISTTNPVVRRGDSKAHVDKLLGASKGWQVGNEETAYYERGYVVFRDGKAVKYAILSDDELLAKKQREARNGEFNYDFEMHKSIPRSSRGELAAREQLAQKQQYERQQEQEREMAYYQQRQSHQQRGQQSADDARGIAIYQQQGLDRQQYEEDAAFVRNLLSESKIPANRNTLNNSASQVEYPSLINEGNTIPRVAINNYVTAAPYTHELNGALLPGSQGGSVVGRSLNGTLLPGSQGGMVIGGPLNGTLMPSSRGGTVVGGPLNGTLLPGSQGGMVIGGPLNGTVMPSSQGGTVVGGPLNGSLLPGNHGGMVIGGPLNGTLLPGSQGGMVIGGP